MRLNSLHVLLTYRCNYECDHCFVWGSPKQSGVFTLDNLEKLLQQATMVEEIEEFYFEGGETFIYYPILVKAVHRAGRLGFRVGVVSNGYWATKVDDAVAWLQPLVDAGLDKLEISVDELHGSETAVASHPGVLAAEKLGLPVSALTTAVGGNGSPVMYRGRAAVELIAGRPRRPAASFTSCPYENLTDPGRIHVDPFGNLHLCQGIVVGNVWKRPLAHILETFDPAAHPIAGPLIEGGPYGLARQYRLPLADDGYVDACHLCYTVRQALRETFPAELAPDQMYGVH